MKRLLNIFCIVVLLALSITPATAADANNCNYADVPSTFSYLNPPADPTKVTPGSVLLGKLTAKASTDTFAIFSLEKTLNDANSISTYFFYFSSNGGKSWSCEKSFSTFATAEVSPNTDYVAIAIGSAQGGKGISSVASFSTKKKDVVLCAPSDAKLSAQYNSNLKQFEVKILTTSTLDLKTSQLKYKVEVSIDNWKTKGTYRDLLGIQRTLYVKPLSETAVHQYRLVPQMDDPMLNSSKDSLVGRYVSTGCASLSTSSSAIDPRSECEKNPYLEKCAITFEPGENASGDPQVAPSPTASKPAVKKTIICVKGKLTKRVTAVNPVCPTGYKKK